MLCLHNACGIFRKFSWLYYLYLQIWNWWVIFYIHETFLVYKLETFAICKEVKHIMLMIITILYIFFLMRYLINSWKLLSKNPQPPPFSLKKSTTHLFAHTPTKNSKKCKSSPFSQNWKFFRHLLQKRGVGGGGGGEDTMYSLVRMVSFFPNLV